MFGCLANGLFRRIGANNSNHPHNPNGPDNPNNPSRTPGPLARSDAVVQEGGT